MGDEGMAAMGEALGINGGLVELMVGSTRNKHSLLATSSPHVSTLVVESPSGDVVCTYPASTAGWC